MEYPKTELDFYKIILNEDNMRNFLIEKNLLHGGSNTSL